MHYAYANVLKLINCTSTSRLIVSTFLNNIKHSIWFFGLLFIVGIHKWKIHENEIESPKLLQSSRVFCWENLMSKTQTKSLPGLFSCQSHWTHTHFASVLQQNLIHRTSHYILLHCLKNFIIIITFRIAYIKWNACTQYKKFSWLKLYYSFCSLENVVALKRAFGLFFLEKYIDNQ